MDINFGKVDFSSPKPLYMQVTEIIEKKIQDNEIPVGQKLPNQENLHRIFNVSLDTIKEAMSCLSNSGYIACRPTHGTVVINSEPKTGVDLKRKNGIFLIICAKPGDSAYNINNLMFRSLLEGLQEKVREKGTYLGFTVLNEDDDELLLGGKEKEIAGFVVAGGKSPKHLKTIKKTRIPFILVGDVLSKTRTEENADVIVNDDFTGAYIATKHLTDLGHRRIAYIHESGEYPWIAEKLEGYKQALKEANIPYDKNLLIKLEIMEPETGYRAMKEFLERSIPFTGLIGVGLDSIGRALKEKGLSVPDDISEVDFGYTEHTHVFYATEEMGKFAFDRLYVRFVNPGWKPERILMPYKLTLRDSTRAIVKNSN
jgi:DNA-binding LacI/PurR family transcriptional regulator